MHACMHAWMDGWMDGCMDGWEGWMDGCMFLLCYGMAWHGMEWHGMYVCVYIYTAIYLVVCIMVYKDTLSYYWSIQVCSDCAIEAPFVGV